MTRAIVLREPGGPETLRLEAVAVGDPGPGEIRLRQTAIGVNFHDIYVRSGLYRTLALPGIPGIEAVGVVEAVGAEVTDLVPGRRVGYVTAGYGAYAETRLLPAASAVALPDTLDDAGAASILLKGLTACMLLRRVHRVEPGETILVHAAAGGVGQLLCAWGKHLGARVIGTVGSPAKAEIALRAGPTTSCSTARRISPPACARSRRARGWPRPTTRSGATPSSARSTASGTSARW